MRVLIADVVGYLGRPLAAALAVQGHEVVCLLPRAAERATGPANPRFVPWPAGPLPDTLVRGTDCGFYLRPSLGELNQVELETARDFALSLRRANAKRLVYLGSVLPGGTPRRGWDALEPLASAAVPVTTLRASLIIGEDSPALEMIRGIVERFPLVLCPAWMVGPQEPVAAEDVVVALAEASRCPRDGCVAGPSIETFSTIMAQYARIRNLRRALAPVRSLSHGLSIAMIAAVTGMPRTAVAALASHAGTAGACSLPPASRPRTDLVQAMRQSLSGPVPIGFRARIATELRRTGHVITRRRGFILGSWETIVPRPVDATFSVIESLGGDKGWLFADELWFLRALIDRLTGGGCALRHRRNPDTVIPGDTVDFWEVEAVQRGQLLRLRAQMRLPGRAWLQFETTPVPQGTLLRQNVIFEPKGLGGEAYWAAMYPFHLLLFDGLHQAIASEAAHQAHPSHSR